MPTGRIQAPNLDDRDWKSIKQKMIEKIPDYAPEWTDHNPSDPGITLIELFAWMADMIIYRLNQVPENIYIAFLNLLDITRNPPVPAKVNLKFTLSQPEVTILKGTLVSTVATETDEAVIFEVDKETKIDKNCPQVSATNALTVKDEKLGESDGTPYQCFNLQNAPLYEEDEVDELVVSVSKDGNSVVWNRVDELHKGDKEVYRCNPVTGEIIFGSKEAGDIPEKGAKIFASQYRYIIGGTKANVAADKVTLMRTPIPGIKSVTNPEAATPGTDWEDIEDTKRRAPQAIKNRDRAVTCEDYEDLVKNNNQWGTQIAKVKCLGPKKIDFDGNNYTYEKKPLDRSPGKVYLLLLPKEATRRPVPSPDLIKKVEDFLDDKRVVTSELHLHHPEAADPVLFFVEIAVEITLYIKKGSVFDDVKQNVLQRMQKFLHPVSGGLHLLYQEPREKGWDFGEDFFRPNLFEAIMTVNGVDFVEIEKITIYRDADEKPDEIKGLRVPIEEYEIVCTAPEKDFNIYEGKQEE